MTDDMASTVPRRQLGRALRELRTEAQMTLDAVAETLQCSRQKIWRIETGLGAVRGVDVRGMCELYRARPKLTAALVGLAGETKTRGWWHAYGVGIPDWFDIYGGLESAASRLRSYDESLIPSLLQARAYARSLLQTDADLTDEELERLVAVRLQRQSLLTRRLPKAPQLRSVISEAVLLRRVGGPALMVEQLQHLLKVAELPNVSIRVLPLTAGAHYGALAGSFTMLDFPLTLRTVPDPPVIYSESMTGALYLDRPEELAAYEQTWSSLDILALNDQQSTQLISKLIEEIRHG